MSDKTLNMNEIFTAKDVRYDYVPTPEWGEGTRVRIASLSAGDVIGWLEVSRDPVAGQRAGLHLIIKALVNDEGVHIGKPEHLEPLCLKDAQVTGRIVDTIMEMNGLKRKKLEPKPDPVADAKNGLSEVPLVASPTT